MPLKQSPGIRSNQGNNALDGLYRPSCWLHLFQILTTREKHNITLICRGWQSQPPPTKSSVTLVHIPKENACGRCLFSTTRCFVRGEAWTAVTRVFFNVRGNLDSSKICYYTARPAGYQDILSTMSTSVVNPRMLHSAQKCDVRCAIDTRGFSKVSFSEQKC